MHQKEYLLCAHLNISAIYINRDIKEQMRPGQTRYGLLHMFMQLEQQSPIGTMYSFSKFWQGKLEHPKGNTYPITEGNDIINNANQMGDRLVDCILGHQHKSLISFYSFTKSARYTAKYICLYLFLPTKLYKRHLDPF